MYYANYYFYGFECFDFPIKCDDFMQLVRVMKQFARPNDEHNDDDIDIVIFKDRDEQRAMHFGDFSNVVSILHWNRTRKEFRPISSRLARRMGWSFD